MRVFLTGATGYLGFAVAKALRQAGHQVAALVRNEGKARQVAAHEIEPVIGTLQNPASYRAAAANATVAIHAAVDYQADVFAVDRIAVETLIAARPGRLIYTSGIWVYGQTGPTVVDERAPVNPPERVGLRPEMERLALDAPSVPAIVFRPGCVFGGAGGMFGMWFEPLARGEPPTIVGDGTNHWPLVHVEDLARAYVLAAESDLGGEILNLADRSRESVTAMVRAASRAAGFDRAPRYQPVAEAARTLGTFAECLTLDQHLDSTRAERLLGWRPRFQGFAGQAELYYRAWLARRTRGAPGSD
jgi:nucleoside-diphosphate-sugar epimerase